MMVSRIALTAKMMDAKRKTPKGILNAITSTFQAFFKSRVTRSSVRRDLKLLRTFLGKM